jgi:hypothetical protein
MRLIDADQFGVIALQGKSEDFIEGVVYMFDKIHEAPTVEAYTFEQVQDLVALNKKLSEEWEYLKEHITELRDANGYATQYGTCKFILNLMSVIEKKRDMAECMDEYARQASIPYSCNKHIKVGNTIYTQDDDKQGWTGKEVE